MLYLMDDYCESNHSSMFIYFMNTPLITLRVNRKGVKGFLCASFQRQSELVLGNHAILDLVIVNDSAEELASSFETS